LQPLDKVRIEVSGKHPDAQTHTVTQGGEQRFKIDHAVIKANENDSIGVMYVVLPGGNPPEKRSGTVEYDVQMAPSIVSVQDSLGDVANNGFTFDSSVTVTGKASIGQRVELFDGTTPKVQAPVDSSGIWTAVVSALAVGQHLVKAVALYGSKLESGGHGFEVRQGATPVISRVVDSKGQPIGNGGRTYETGLTLDGTAQTGLQVQILDNGTPRTTVAAPGGNWQAPLSALATGRHAFTAKGLYGNQPVSGEWIVTVENRPPLVIDTSTMVLDGRVFVRGDDGQGPSTPPANAARQRVASGGVPPYSYSSSNTGVASVDASGTVRSRANGSAVITVRDQAQQAVSYNVTVQNVVRMYLMGSSQYIVGWDQRIFMSDLREVFNQYRAGGGLGQLGWPGGTYWSRDQRQYGLRQQAQHKDMDGGGEGWSAQIGPSFPGIRLG
ncbi:Ig-like domain-containing protein, partial [Pseudomonas sp. UBA4617]|uniref:Ig-like domain-containing protein n=1 Tax=Pseudomonas sp. UBA4617 TaxID=1947318 RepID=UPI0025E72908